MKNFSQRKEKQLPTLNSVLADEIENNPETEAKPPQKACSQSKEVFKKEKPKSKLV